MQPDRPEGGEVVLRPGDAPSPGPLGRERHVGKRHDLVVRHLAVVVAVGPQGLISLSGRRVPDIADRGAGHPRLAAADAEQPAVVGEVVVPAVAGREALPVPEGAVDDVVGGGRLAGRLPKQVRIDRPGGAVPLVHRKLQAAAEHAGWVAVIHDAVAAVGRGAKPLADVLAVGAPLAQSLGDPLMLRHPDVAFAIDRHARRVQQAQAIPGAHGRAASLRADRPQEFARGVESE
jgi:hypothetical protein